MEIYLKGTPEESNNFLYGNHVELDDIEKDDDPNIPIGDDEESDAAKADNAIANIVGLLAKLVEIKENESQH